MCLPKPMRSVVSTLTENPSDLGQDPTLEQPPPEKPSELEDPDVNLCIPAKRRVEDTSEDKHAKRPREEVDEHGADDGYTDGPPFVKDKDAIADVNLCLPANHPVEVGETKSLLPANRPKDEFDIEVPPFVKASNAIGGEEEEEDEEDEGEEDDDDEEEDDEDEDEDEEEGFAVGKKRVREGYEDFFDVGGGDDDDGGWGGCDACVPRQVCSVCGYKDGCPPKCPYCGKDGDYLMCKVGPVIENWDSLMKQLAS